jgi:DNA-binding CsgD family transcriptional regulator
MALLERGALLAALDRLHADAGAGSGSLALLAGEAGVGKTSLARAFCDQREAGTRVLWGSCDALRTPRPLGPLYDIARQAGGELAAAMAGSGTPQHERFTAFLDTLVSPLRPVVAVIEDVHWADEASLDLLVYLARRVAGSNAVVIVTYRDDEAGPDHPLRTVLGHLGGSGAVHRLPLRRLSSAATAKLAAPHGADPDRVYRVTGGNPFFVTELLATAGDTIPETVRDAVLARAARLSAPARAVLEAVAVVPDRAEIELVRAVTGDPDPAPLEECAYAGMLHFAGRSVRFRHELARLAVENSISAARSGDLHAGVLAHLAGQPGADLARLAYHADQAGDRDAVLAHAPAAAVQAARLGAHRQAAAHYQRALRHAGALPPAERAELLERYAEECVVADQASTAIDATGQALACWQELGEVERAATVMARRAMLLCLAARNREADELVRQAIAQLAGRPPSEALAAAYATMANVRMLNDDNAVAAEVGLRAVSLAEQYGNPHVLTRALNAVGSASWFGDPDRAEAMMVRCISVARDAGSDRMVSAAMVNMGSRAAVARRYQAADRWLQETIGYCEPRDLDSHRVYALAWLARCHFEQGRWPQAEEAAAAAIGQTVAPEPAARIVALTVQGRLRTRRGEPDADLPLDTAWQLADRTDELQRRWPVIAGRAEAAWLAGTLAKIAPLLAETLAVATRRGHPWAAGELAFWLWRAGSPDPAPSPAAEPYARQIAGDWRGAAAAWEALGCPYEAAVARADSDDPDDLLAALAEFHRLGARPAADRLIRQLRGLGVRRLPRRPQRTTSDNPGGLTDRQLQVLSLLTAGLSNGDIAIRLHISPRTADHHVSAILSKLGAGSRHDAARTARRWGISPNGRSAADPGTTRPTG